MDTPGRIWFLGISMEMHVVWFRGGCNSYNGAFGQRRYHATMVHEESTNLYAYFVCSCNKKGRQLKIKWGILRKWHMFITSSKLPLTKKSNVAFPHILKVPDSP